MKRAIFVVLLLLAIAALNERRFFHVASSAGGLRTPQPYMAFEKRGDCERFADTAFTTDAAAVKRLWNAGRARFMTRAAEISVKQRPQGAQRCAEIMETDDATVLYVSKSVAEAREANVQ